MSKISLTDMRKQGTALMPLRLAALWDQQGDPRSFPSGTITVGREGIARPSNQTITGRMQEGSVAQIAVQPEAVRPLAPGLVTVDGRFQYRGQSGAERREELFTFVLVRLGDMWRILSARIPAVPAPDVR